MIRLLRLHRCHPSFSSVKDRIRKQRAQRLSKLQQSLPTKTNQNLSLIRNIGIIAHIDAGKTTTTQRMLFYSGALTQPGQVDQGTTTMDYLPQQRARGITIRSAAISFNWHHHQINLIDTPGHVDFSGEVARSLRVLDGVVTIFDAVHGVQTQTEKVWGQANNKGLPKLAFVNKMDRLGAGLGNTVRTMRERLKVEGFVLQEAIGEAEGFKGVVDLLKMEAITFEGFRGENPTIKPLTQSDGLYQPSLKSRQLLIQKISQYDDQLADLYLSGKPISAIQIMTSVKRVINHPKYLSKTCAVLLGASAKNKGVQPLLDAIINYLPSPTEGNPVRSVEDPKQVRKPVKNERLCAYIFKIIYDKEKGPLSYARVYSGTLHRSTALRNTTKQVLQKIQFLYRVRADNYVLVQQVFAGDIIAIAGLKNSSAGDTLISCNDQKFLLQQLQLPAAIFMAPFQVQSISQQSQLQKQLRTISKQDNSLTVTPNSQTGQLVVSGLGELHLQIVRDRLTESGIPTKMGKLRIGYRETFGEKTRKRMKFVKTVNKQEFWVDLEVEIVPVRAENGEGYLMGNEVVVGFSRPANYDAYWAEYMKRRVMAQKKRNMDEGADTDVDMGRIKDKEPTAADKSFGRYVKNPTKLTPIDQQGQTPQIHHINTLSFQLLQSLIQAIKLTLHSGRFHYPLISLQIHLTNGSYDPSKLTKPILIQAASKLMKQVVQSHSILLQPIVDVELVGEQELIEHAVKDIIKKRGRVEEREGNRVRAKVPAEGIRGWVKTLRAMGFDTEIKFSCYQQVQGISPAVLVANEE